MLVSSLTKMQFRRLIENLQEIAHDLKAARQEREKQEGEEKNENENHKK